jgi:hypothetical protein
VISGQWSVPGAGAETLPVRDWQLTTFLDLSLSTILTASANINIGEAMVRKTPDHKRIQN